MKPTEKKIKKYLKDRGWDNIRPGDLAKSISIEAAELLELFQWSNEDIESLKQNKDKFENLKKELADVFIYALDLAVVLGIDSEKIINAKIEHNIKKFPVEKIKDSKEFYFKVKKEYREKGLS